jgi:hypothetical protein
MLCVSFHLSLEGAEGRMPMFHSLTFAILLQVSVVQADSSPVLYVIENVASDRGLIETRNLVRLSMDLENKLVRETLVSEDQGFFGHTGGARIALGRFIVTKYGGVVDIQGRKVIHDDDRARVLGIEDGKVVYCIPALQPSDFGGSSDLSGLFSFDLNERKVAKVEKGSHWDLPGTKSPDKTMSIVNTFSGRHRLYLHRLGKTPHELAKGARITYSDYASPSFGATPCLWLDGERILVGQTNRKLVTITTQGSVEKSIEVKDAPAEVISPPTLWRDAQGKVIYSCGDEDFLIDVPNGVGSPLKSYSLGQGFDASVAVDKDERRSVSRDGKTIGQWAFNPREAVTAPGLLALPYVRLSKVTASEYLAGIAVWNTRVGDWQTIEMSVNDLMI